MVSLDLCGRRTAGQKYSVALGKACRRIGCAGPSFVSLRMTS